MANAGSFTYSINFKTDTTGLNKAKSALEQLQKIRIKDAMNMDITYDQKAFNKLNQDLTKAKEEALIVERALEQAFNPKLNTININKFNQTLANSGLTIGQCITNWGRFGEAGQTAIKNVLEQYNKLTTATYQQSELLKKMKESLGNVLRYNINTAALRAVTSNLSGAVSYAKELDSSLNNIRIVTNKNAGEMEKFAKSANKAAQALGQTTTNYTDAALIYFQQGLAEDVVEKYTDVTLKVQNITKQNADAVSEELTAVWNGFQVNASQAEFYIDKLAAVAATSASDLEEIATAMSKVAATANTVGVDIDSLTSQISTIVSVTRQAPESVGTALKTIYARLGDLKVDGVDEFGVELGQVSSQLEQMGINILDSSGQMRQMQDIIVETADKWQTWTAAQKQAAAIAMAGKRQYTMLMALFENWNMYTDNVETAKNALGTLEKQQNIYLNSLEAAENKLAAKKEELQSNLLGTDDLKAYYEFISDIVGGINDIVEALGGGKGVILSVVPVLTSLFSEKITNNIFKMASNIDLFGQKMNAMRQKSAIDMFGASPEVARNMQNQQTLKQGYQAGLVDEKAYEDFSKINEELISSDGIIDALTQDVAKALKEFKDINIELDKLATLSDDAFKTDVLKQFEQEVEKNQKNIEKYTNQIKELEIIMSQVGTTYDNENVVNGFKENKNASSFTKTQREKIANIVSEKDAEGKLLDVETRRANLEKYLETIIKKRANADKQAEKTGQALTKVEALRKKQLEDLKNAEQKLGQAQMARDTSQKMMVQGTINAVSSVGMLSSSMDNLTHMFVNGEFSLANFTMGLTMFVSSANNMIKGLTSIQQGYQGYKAALEGIKTAEAALAATQAAATITLEGKTVALGGLTAAELEKLLMSEACQGEEAKAVITTLLKIATDKKAETQEKKHAKSIILKMAAQKGENAETEKSIALEQAKQLLQKKSIVALGAAAAAVLAVVAAVKILDAVYKKNAQTEANNAEARQKQAEAQLKLLQTQEEGLNQVVELNKQYKNGEITLADFKNKLLEVADQYKFTSEMVQALTADYENETAAVLGLQAAIAKQSAEQSEAAAKAIATKDKSTSAAHKGWFKKTFNLDEYGGHLTDAVVSSLGVGDPTTAEGWKTFGLATGKNAINALVNTATLGTGNILSKALTGKTVGANLLPSETQADKDNTVFLKELADNAQQLAKSYGAEISEEDLSKILAGKLSEVSADAYEAISGAMRTMEFSGQAMGSGLFETLSKDEDLMSAEFGKYFELIQANRAKELEEQIAEISKKAVDYTGYSEAVKELTTLLSQQDEFADASMQDIEDMAKAKINDALEEASGDSYRNINALIEQLTPKMFQESELAIGSALETIASEFPEFYQALINGEIDNLVPSGASIEQVKELAAQYQNAADHVATLTNLSSAITAVEEHADNLTDEELANIKNLEAEHQELANIRDRSSEEYLSTLKAIREQEEQLQTSDLAKNLKYYVSKAKIDIDGDPASFNNTMDQLLDADYELYLSIKTDIEDDIKEVDKAYKKIQDAASKIGENYVVSLSDIDELREVFPGILEDAKTTADGQIQLNKQVVDSALAAAQDEANADKAATEEKIRDKIAYAEGMAAQYRKLAEAAQKMYDIETGAAEDSTEARAEFDAALANVSNLTNAQIADDGVTAYDEIQNASIDCINTQLSGLKELADESSTVYKTMSKMQQAIANGQYEYAEALANELANMTPKEILGHDISGAYDAQKWAESQNYINTAVQAARGDIAETSIKYKEIADSANATADYWESIADAWKDYLKDLQLTEDVTNNVLSTLGDIKDAGEDITENAAEYDAYLHDIERTLNSINNEMSELEEMQDKLDGQDLYDNLNEQLSVLEAQNEALKEKESLQTAELNRQKLLLSAESVLFDENGEITNYQAIAQTYVDAINKAVAGGDAEAAKTLTEKWNQVQSQMDAYESLFDERTDTQSEIRTTDSSIKNKRVLQGQIKLNATIDWADTENEIAEFKKEMAEDDDYVFRIQTDADSVDVARKKMEATNEWAQTVANELAKIQAGGESDLFETEEQAEQALKVALQNNREAILGYEQAVKKVNEDLVESIMALGDSYEDTVDIYDHISNQLDHDIKVMQLIYGDDSFDKIGAFYDQKVANDEKTLQTLREEADMWEQKMNSVSPESEEWKTYYQKFLETNEKVNKALEQELQDIQDRYSNTIGEIFSNLEKQLTGGTSFDWLKEEYNLQKKVNDLYLDKVNRAYEIGKLERQYNKEIAGASLNGQKKLTAAMNKQLDYLRNKENLSQYDIERAQKLYDLTVAQYQLEDARQNKSQLMLQRNAQGNYEYRYTADSAATADAESRVEDAYNALYNFDKDAYNTNLETMLTLTQECSNKIKAIWEDTTLSREEKEKRAQETYDYYEKLINAGAEQNKTIRLNLNNDLTDGVKNNIKAIYDAFDLTSKNINDNILGTYWNKTLKDTWDGAIQAMISNIDGGKKESGDSLKAIFTAAMSECNAAADDLASHIDTACKSAGVSLDDLNNAIDPVITTMSSLVEQTKEFTNRLRWQVENTTKICATVNAQALAYDSLYNKIKDANEQMGNLLKSTLKYDTYISTHPVPERPKAKKDTETPGLPDIIAGWLGKGKDPDNTDTNTDDTKTETGPKPTVTPDASHFPKGTISLQQQGNQWIAKDSSGNTISDNSHMPIYKNNKQEWEEWARQNNYTIGGAEASQGVRGAHLEASQSGYKLMADGKTLMTGPTIDGLKSWASKNNYVITNPDFKKAVTKKDVVLLKAEGKESYAIYDIKTGKQEKTGNSKDATAWEDEYNIKAKITNAKTIPTDMTTGGYRAVILQDAFGSDMHSVWIANKDLTIEGDAVTKIGDKYPVDFISKQWEKPFSFGSSGDPLYFQAPPSGKKAIGTQTLNGATIIDNKGKFGKWGSDVWKHLSNKALFKAVAFNTGGYTGDWAGSDGKMAMLHQKELVLNKDDTSNMLTAVDIVRQISDSLNGRIANLNAAIGSAPSLSGGTTNNNTSQNMTIYADFPNLTDAVELKNAFDNLANFASQQVGVNQSVIRRTF